ncbi:MAG: hypothetical protein H6835_09340 [Planctomycetes bacterium]|nr:hypothetical protein [Planctomycetota bacterium]
MTKNLSDEMQRTARQALAGLQPMASGEEVGGLPVRRLLAAFFRARYLVFGTTLFGVLIGTFLAITTPNNYVSEGKFVFTSSGAESRLLDPTQAKETSQETIATSAAYILNSDDLLLRVVRDLGPARVLQPYQPDVEGVNPIKAAFFTVQREWNAVAEENWTEDEALKQLKRTISVERPPYQNVLIATCSANNAELAQEILARWMDEAIKWHIEKYDDQKLYEDAQKAYEASVVAHDTAQAAMREFLDRKAKVPQFDDALERLQEEEIDLAGRVQELHSDLTLKKSLLERVEKDLADPERLPPTRTRMVPAASRSDVLDKLQDRLAQAKIELTNLRVQLSDPNHIDIRDKLKAIAAIEKTIVDVRATEADNTLVPETSENPQYMKALEERDSYDREVGALGVQESEATKNHTAKLEELRRLLALQPEYENLRNRVIQTETTRSNSLSNFQLAQQKRTLGLGNYSALKNMQAASMPLEKEGPNRGKLLIGGLFVGLFLGLGVVVLRALPDNVVRTRDDLEQIEGLAVIGVMPRLDRTNLRRHVALREQGW